MYAWLAMSAKVDAGILLGELNCMYALDKHCRVTLKRKYIRDIQRSHFEVVVIVKSKERWKEIRRREQRVYMCDCP